MSALPLEPVVAALHDRHASRNPVLVGITGPVAVGKSALAQRLVQLVEPLRAAVIGTDGFLLPNAALEAAGLMERKGFPESHRLDALAEFLTTLRRGEPAAAPVYSHEIFDVVPDTYQWLDGVQIVLLEGVVALHADIRPLLDLGIYVDAPPADILAWYLARRAALRGDSEAERRRGLWLWETVNRPNADQNIEATRSSADFVVTKGPDHRIVSVERL